MLELDHPFELQESDLEEIRPMTLLPPRLNTPGGGEELVDPAWLEEQTLVMPQAELAKLLEQEQLVHKLTADLHTRPTVRSMEAVVPLSRRPPPESLVSVVPAPNPSQRPALVLELAVGEPE